MDWKTAVKAIAPTLGALASATGPAGALAGAAITAVANALGVPASGDPVRDEDEVAKTIALGITPDQRAALIQADLDYRKAALQAASRDKEIDADVEKANYADIKDARSTHGTDRALVLMGCGVLAIWAILTGGTLAGLYVLLTGGIKIVDVGIVATVFTVLGSTVGYVSNSAQQVLSYFFGSSRGSAQKTEQMASAIQGAFRR